MTLEPFVKAGWRMTPKQGFSDTEAGGTRSRIVETPATAVRLDSVASNAGRARQKVGSMGEESLTS